MSLLRLLISFVLNLLILSYLGLSLKFTINVREGAKVIGIFGGQDDREEGEGIIFFGKTVEERRLF